MSTNNGKGVISSRIGLIIFIVFAVVGAFLLFLLMKPSHTPKVILNPTPTASSTPWVNPSTAAPLPTVAATTGSQSYATRLKALEPAQSLALKLTTRDSQSTYEETILLVDNLISPELKSSLNKYVASWDWKGCLATQCYVFPQMGSIGTTMNGADYVFTITVTPMKDNTTALPAKVFVITSAQNSQGIWKVVKIGTLPPA